MTALRRSRSLQAVHLSYNPFLHEATIDDIQREAVTLRSKVITESKADWIVEAKEKLQVPESEFEAARLQQWRKDAVAGSKKAEDWMVRSHELVLQRILGHKVDIPGLAQWTVHASQAQFDERPEA